MDKLSHEQQDLYEDILIFYKKHVKDPGIFFHDIVFLYYDDLIMLEKLLKIFVILDLDMNICDKEDRNIIHKLVLFMDRKNKKKIKSCINLLIKYKIDYNKYDMYDKTPGDYERYFMRSRL